MHTIYTVLITAPVNESGKIARILVEERLAACVNIVPEIRSIYRWQGKIEEESESLLIVKTTAERMDELKSRVLEIHPYNVPEIIALPVADGLEKYLNWVRDETSTEDKQTE
ncbi:MAG: divalent-cation tolerance protein CutA [candidate division Zixibacteria bacterium]|nr:divalent-cation tolerance protein CutA [candidate division Zixibacteria bacterium]